MHSGRVRASRGLSGYRWFRYSLSPYNTRTLVAIHAVLGGVHIVHIKRTANVVSIFNSRINSIIRFIFIRIRFYNPGHDFITRIGVSL